MLTFFSTSTLTPQALNTYNTDHHNGKRFVNNKGEPKAPDFKFKRSSGRDVTEPLPVRDPTQDFTLGNGIRQWWIGHATNLIQINDKFIITDPIFSDHAAPVSWIVKRVTQPACTIELLPPISYVLISHCHWDHLDKASIIEIHKRNPNCQFFVPLNVGKMMDKWGIKNIVEFDWRTHVVVDDIDFTCFPSHHGSARWGFDSSKTLWCSWMISSNNVSIYYTGDTAIGPHFKEIHDFYGKGPDLFIVGIGPQEHPEMMRSVHMNGKDAWDMCEYLQPKKVVPMHYGTFALGGRPVKTDLEVFREHADPEKILVNDIGGRLDWNGEVFVKAA